MKIHMPVKGACHDPALSENSTPNDQEAHPAQTRSDVHDLARVEDVEWVETSLELPHHLDGVLAVLRHEVLLLAHANAVLACAGAARGERARHQPLIDGIQLRHVLGRVVVTHKEDAVEVAVARVPKNGTADAQRSHVLRRLAHHLRQS